MSPDRLSVLFSLPSAHFHTGAHAFRQRCSHTDTRPLHRLHGPPACQSPIRLRQLRCCRLASVSRKRSRQRATHTDKSSYSSVCQQSTSLTCRESESATLTNQAQRRARNYSVSFTSKRRLLSLMVAPKERLSFLGSGLEEPIICFLEVFSWVAAKNTQKMILIKYTFGTNLYFWLQTWCKYYYYKTNNNKKKKNGLKISIFTF